jgi:hypothetical protein
VAFLYDFLQLSNGCDLSVTCPSNNLSLFFLNGCLGVANSLFLTIGFLLCVSSIYDLKDVGSPASKFSWIVSILGFGKEMH